MSGHRYALRVARPEDADSVTAVLTSAYPRLMAADYDPAVLAVALPAMTVANPALLASGTYYVHVAPGSRIVSCGGWTHDEPGTKEVDSGVAHLRHFGTHVAWTRQGLGAAIVERCRQDALAAGIRTLMCFSTLGAERFYASLGFRAVERRDIAIGPVMKFPTVTMVWNAP